MDDRDFNSKDFLKLFMSLYNKIKNLPARMAISTSEGFTFLLFADISNISVDVSPYDMIYISNKYDLDDDPILTINDIIKVLLASDGKHIAFEVYGINNKILTVCPNVDDIRVVEDNEFTHIIIGANEII